MRRVQEIIVVRRVRKSRCVNPNDSGSAKIHFSHRRVCSEDSAAYNNLCRFGILELG
jgi:hypothetical protein